MPAAAVENPDEAESVEQWNTLGLGNLVTIISASLKGNDSSCTEPCVESGVAGQVLRLTLCLELTTGV